MYFAPQRDSARMQLDFNTALRDSKRALQLAAEAFPRPIDPMGADVGAIRSYSDKLVVAIEKLRSPQ